MQQHNKLHYVNKVYQTEAYQLNIIEKDDNFSTDPLNENMEKLDDTLLAAHMGAVAEHDQRTSETAALDQRITALEVHKIAAGAYEGKGSEQIIELGFTPAAVLVARCVDNCTGLAVTGHQYGYESHMLIAVAENGFKVGSSLNTGGFNFNNAGTRYHYVAFG